jgi:hypothetical protein
MAPNGCAHCGIEQRCHFRRWTDDAGWHAWTAPTDEQRKARMLTRRSAPTPTPSTPEDTPDEH